MILVSVGLATLGACLWLARRARPFLDLRRELRRKRWSCERGLPGLVVLLQIAVRGGDHPRQALATVAKLDTGGTLREVIDVLGDVHGRIALGADLTDAMLDADLPEPGIERVLDALRRAERDGGPLSSHLEVLVTDLRRRRITSLDAAAQRLTVFMLFPLVLCVLPAFVLLAVAPLLRSALPNVLGA